MFKRKHKWKTVCLTREECKILYNKYIAKGFSPSMAFKKVEDDLKELNKVGNIKKGGKDVQA